MRHVFISPHLDDAVLSAGGKLLELVNLGKDVLVVTVFTSFGKGPISKDSKRFVNFSGFQGLTKFTKTRRQEDKIAMKLLGVKYRHLGVVDGGFRKINNKVIYPKHNKKNLFSGKIASGDQGLVDKIENILLTIIKSNDVIYGPIGQGNHVDHLIVNKALARFNNEQYMWLDQPYAKGIRVRPSQSKLKLINCYRSQIKCIFKKRQIRLVKEKLILRKKTKIGIVSSLGGHLFQMYQLRDWWDDYDRFWVTDKGSDGKSLLENEKIYCGYFPEHRNVINAIRNLLLAIKVIIQQKPDMLVSCGAGIAVPFFYVGKIFGSKLIFIEPFDFVKFPSLTGRLVAPIVDKLLVQHKKQLKFFNNAEYWGSTL